MENRSSGRAGAAWTLLLLAASAFGCARQHEPAGLALYLRHCASCHGETGRGDGPVARNLVTPPADLTQLARRSGGRFDPREVLRKIDGRVEVTAHGSREMPVWGAVFEDELSDQRYPAYTTLLHTKSLAEYLESIQEP